MLVVETSFSARLLALTGIGLVTICAIGAFPASSMAQEATKSISDTWVVTLGATVEYGPNYEGSKHYSFSALPSF
ncbi:MipA/OmpV family protein, partial [Agrobacterium rhizogenes]|nr:MipA/OmpV family protein [Rhizobium rhizogenes]